MKAYTTSSTFRIDICLIFLIGLFYFSGIVLLTVGFFTPVWIHINVNDDYYRNRFYPMYWYYYQPYSCYSVGILKNLCDGSVMGVLPYHLKHVLWVVYIMMTSVMVAAYVIFGMVAGALIFGLNSYATYMAFLSVFVGVLYPCVGILTLVASIYVIGMYPFHFGYSTILCLTAGILMIASYGGLFLYDILYLKKKDRQPRVHSNRPLLRISQRKEEGIDFQRYTGRFSSSSPNGQLDYAYGRTDGFGRPEFLHGSRSRGKLRNDRGKGRSFRSA